MTLTAEDIDALYRSHARAMVTYFSRRTLDPEAAIDLVAETFAVAIASGSRCRATGHDERAAWLFGIARNQLHAWYRHGAIERRALERVGLERPFLVDADVERIDELAGLREQRSRVAALLEHLSADARTALRMRVVEERSYSEMAGMLGVSEQTVRARVSRGLRSLAVALDGAANAEAEAGSNTTAPSGARYV